MVSLFLLFCVIIEPLSLTTIHNEQWEEWKKNSLVHGIHVINRFIMTRESHATIFVKAIMGEKRENFNRLLFAEDCLLPLGYFKWLQCSVYSEIFISYAWRVESKGFMLMGWKVFVDNIDRNKSKLINYCVYRDEVCCVRKLHYFQDITASSY